MRVGLWLVFEVDGRGGGVLGVGGIGRGLRVMGVGLVEMVGVEGGLEDVVGCVLPVIIIKGHEETKASTT